MSSVLKVLSSIKHNLKGHKGEQMIVSYFNVVKEFEIRKNNQILVEKIMNIFSHTENKEGILS